MECYELWLGEDAKDTPKVSRKRINLSPEQLQWLVEHYPTHTDKYLASQLGCGFRSIARILARNGYHLKKDAEHMAQWAKVGRDRARLSAVSNGSHSASHLRKLKKGHRLYDSLTEEQKQQRNRHMSESMRSLWASERRRSAYGLKQRTKLQVNKQPKKITRLRYRLTEVGYEIARASYDVWVPMDIVRHPIMEQTAVRLGFNFHEQ